jgi:uncharacterized protein YfaT (DUF1175 family)
VIRPHLPLAAALTALACGQPAPHRPASSLQPPASDLDGDGYPDAAELTSQSDRAAFLSWFALLAEAQATAPDPRWDPAQRDCAGLLRFAYRGALARHDARWLRAGPPLPGTAPEVERFHGPAVPVLGERLFRIGSGPFDPARVEQDFAPTASAERLVRGSARPLRPGESPARGDVLLYRDVGRGLAHAMVYLGEGRVVYHTGPRDDGPGEVRLTTLAALRAHPDPVWRPDAANPAFAGYYRWRIVGPGAQP